MSISISAATWPAADCCCWGFQISLLFGTSRLQTPPPPLHKLPLLPTDPHLAGITQHANFWLSKHWLTTLSWNPNLSHACWNFKALSIFPVPPPINILHILLLTAVPEHEPARTFHTRAKKKKKKNGWGVGGGGGMKEKHFWSILDADTLSRSNIPVAFLP